MRAPLAAVLLLAGAAAAQEGPGPFSAEIVLSRTTFPVMSERDVRLVEAYRDALGGSPEMPTDPTPEAPALAARLVVTNKGAQPVTFWRDPLLTRIELVLDGPGAAQATTAWGIGRSDEPDWPSVTLHPGETYSFAIPRLVTWEPPDRQTRNLYWLRPGKYGLLAKVHLARGLGGTGWWVVRAPSVRFEVK